MTVPRNIRTSSLWMMPLW